MDLELIFVGKLHAVSGKAWHQHFLQIGDLMTLLMSSNSESLNTVTWFSSPPVSPIAVSEALHTSQSTTCIPAWSQGFLARVASHTKSSSVNLLHGHEMSGYYWISNQWTLLVTSIGHDILANIIILLFTLHIILFLKLFILLHYASSQLLKTVCWIFGIFPPLIFPCKSRPQYPSLQLCSLWQLSFLALVLVSYKMLIKQADFKSANHRENKVTSQIHGHQTSNKLNMCT